MAICTALICDDYRHAAPVFGVVPDAADLRSVDLPLYPQTLYGTSHGQISRFSNGTAFNTSCWCRALITSLSSLFRNHADLEVCGRLSYTAPPITREMQPQMMKSHRHAFRSLLSPLNGIAYEISPQIAPDSAIEPWSTAMRLV